jgi:hypothetical protein
VEKDGKLKNIYKITRSREEVGSVPWEFSDWPDFPGPVLILQGNISLKPL